jgi:hypothetical protein
MTRLICHLCRELTHPLGHGCDESSNGLHMSRVIYDSLPRPSAGGFLLVAPVVGVGVDAVAGDELVGVLGDDGDRGGGDKDKDFSAGVGNADAEVMQAAGVTQGEFAAVIDRVAADAKVFGGLMSGGQALGRAV